MGFYRGANVVTSGLVLALDAANPKSYPGSGTTWSDLSGNGNTGTLTNGPTFNSANGGSIAFDGTNDYVTMGNILNVGSSPFSIEFYARATTTTSNYGKVVSKGFYQNSGWLCSFAKVPSGEYVAGIEFYVGVTTYGIASITSASLNTWYQMSYVRDSSNQVSTYLNGSFVASSNIGSINLNSSYNYMIGMNGIGNELFKGDVALHRHYNRALTPTEIQQNYNATKTRFNL
jgi:hypothetical protein